MISITIQKTQMVKIYDLSNGKGSKSNADETKVEIRFIIMNLKGFIACTWPLKLS
jgi:hypothetical protein